ncbi:MAG: cytochrome d ubiquinol oxidase subunit II [candidate division KSB1 bacterium]|nr:cytochrome d ubiquinol oxidase subunit II [candidate division KSB1 bacterium]MDZ7336803.1 cytochrome d ubiquinol oxidase subunit II [candidate division KSB1 bacterium]MDZ7358965.1 cytochrome d ubiquinol oxidase subunit II [candidate division KSB1 bacterium]MDZ7402323.1 cytochrome d ubiquinol oxidase subunit II [candidate division KSB1 bacterium]
MESLSFFQNIWYILIGVLLIGYSILDGFDLGIGSLLPFLAKNETDKRTLYNAIGPFWDGNEVWLLTGGGALFAAFPHVYATVFSGFYLALMLVLFALIFRAVALEFGSHDEKRKKFWEWAFVIGSFLPALLYGVALGNVLVGIPLDDKMEFTGNFFTLLRPFPLVVGLLGLTAILMQGATYAAMKTEGQLQQNAKKAINILWVGFIVLLVLSFITALIFKADVAGNVLAYIAALVVLVAWYLVKRSSQQGKEGQSFLMSSLAFLGLWGIVGAIHYPNLVTASNDPSLSLTISNASSTQLTLTVMFIIAVVGMPIVIGYTIYAYRVFKGKVKLG